METTIIAQGRQRPRSLDVLRPGIGPKARAFRTEHGRSPDGPTDSGEVEDMVSQIKNQITDFRLVLNSI